MLQIVDPTKSGLREYDAWGSGYFKTSRGNRKHRGVDFKCEPGQIVVSPVDGVIIRAADPYGDGQYSGVFIDGLNFEIKMFYLKPYPRLIGEKVTAGQPIGIAQNIAKRYDHRMTPHIHLEIFLTPRDYFSVGAKVYIDPKVLL